MSLKFTRLTRAKIKELTVSASITEHGITATGLKGGDVRYAVNIMVDGRRIHRAIGKASEGVTRQQAEDAIELLRTRAREDRLGLPTGRKTHRMFEETATGYLERLVQGTGKNLTAKRRQLITHLIPAFRKHRADKITTQMVQSYVRDRLSTGAAQATVNRELATLSHLFKRMIEWKWIKAEDAPVVSKGAEPPKAITVLSDADAASLRNAAIGDQDGLLHLFVEFGLGAAMRHGEILRVRYDQINFDARRIYLARAKAGAREQPITPNLAACIAVARERATDKTGWVFPSQRKGEDATHRLSMAKQFKRAVERAGLSPQRVTPHVMRHTAITRLVQAGVDLPTIQKISGHKTLLMVMRYVHIYGTHIDNAISALDSAPIAITPKLPPVPETDAFSGAA